MKKLTWRHYAIAVASLLLLSLFIFPEHVAIDRNVLLLLGVIVLLVLWPTLKSGKIPYILDFKRRAERKVSSKK